MAVIDSAFETKGTQIYFQDSTLANVLRLTCPTGITGINGGTKDKIDTTCLDQTGSFRTFIGGFADASEVQVPFILYDGDVSQAELFDLQQRGTVVGWFVGLSDGTTTPSAASDGLQPPTDRTGFAFQGYVSNLTFDAAINEVVRGALTIQPVGFTDYTTKSS